MKDCTTTATKLVQLNVVGNAEFFKHNDNGTKIIYLNVFTHVPNRATAKLAPTYARNRFNTLIERFKPRVHRYLLSAASCPRARGNLHTFSPVHDRLLFAVQHRSGASPPNETDPFQLTYRFH